MTTITAQLDSRELAVDRQAVAAINFCALWPTAKPILLQLAAVVSSSIVKFAINTVISAGDAYCPAKTPMTKEDILAQLRNQGITNLDDLAEFGVKKSSGAVVAGYSFIAPSFIAA